MGRSKTHFEQIPIEIVKKIAKPETDKKIAKPETDKKKERASGKVIPYAGKTEPYSVRTVPLEGRR